MSSRARNSSTSAEIRAEIERTREAMDATLDGLGELLNPSRLVRAARRAVEDLAADALRTASSSPMAVIGSGLVIGFILGRLAGRRR